MRKTVWLNGKLITENEAKISIFDTGRLYGACFYESMRTFRHKYFLFEEHMTRLERSLRYSGLIKDVDMGMVRKACNEVLEENIKGVPDDFDFWTCVEVTPGDTFPMPLMKKEDARPNIFAYIVGLPFHEYARYYEIGKPGVCSLYRNIPPQCFEQRCKNRSRLSHFLSKLDAKRINTDAFAFMLDVDGFISEGTGANMFFVLKDIIYTPKTRNILVGESRNFVIKLAKKISYRVTEKDITLYEAYCADEAFWTTSSFCLLPMTEIDGRKIGNGLPGKYSKELLNAWSEEVGVNIVSQAIKYCNKTNLKILR
jgi:branched-chain amino acid aminotransferase